ncbi:TolC family protein [Rickettsia sp. TH2014]|uniref:TolC family protein n=1 Tax=Rickettsia sp. TH2014 TaxID=1967503 RepID=UPI0021149AA0|nr:TolC family protein [Rickettsia sp. TH2014]
MTNKTFHTNKLISLIFIFLLCNCSAKQNNTIPSLSLPTSWNNYSLEHNNNTPSKWWLQFNDPVLNNLIEESLTGNSDIELAMSNVLAAKAQLNLVNSYRFPQINLQGGANRTKNSKETKAPNEPKFSNNFGLASVLNYELDL